MQSVITPADRKKDLQNRAWRTAQEFNRLLPSLTKFARALTGNNKLQVVSTSGQTQTDGKKVWINPPRNLGLNTRHIRSLCNVRNEFFRIQCKACDARELLMGSLYHEISHIIFGTLVAPNTAGKDLFSDRIKAVHNGCSHAPALLRAVDEVETYLQLGGLYDPRLVIIVNAVEDVRVNNAMFDARPGTRSMMTAVLSQVFMEGVDQHDGSNFRWQDRDTESQLIAGILLAGNEYYEWLEELSEEVQQVILHPEMMQFLSRIRLADDVHSMAGTVLEMYDWLQEQGFYKPLTCEEAEKEDEPSPDTPSLKEGSDADSGGSPGDEGDASDASAGDEQRDSKGDPAQSAGSNSRAATSPDPGGDNEQTSSPGGAGQPPASEETELEAESESTSGNSEDAEESGQGSHGSRAADHESHEETSGNGDGEDSTDSTDGEANVDEGHGSSTDSTSRVPGEHGEPDGDEHLSEDSPEGAEGDDETESIDPAAELEESVNRLRDTARRLSLHPLIEKRFKEIDRKNFASGEDDICTAAHSHDEQPDEDLDVDDVLILKPGDLREFLHYLDLAIEQVDQFEGLSTNIGGVEEFTYPAPQVYWEPYGNRADSFAPSESTISRCVLEARVAFDANRKAKFQGGLRSGRVNARSLGKRAPVGDDRIFRHKVIPSKRDHHVIIGMDVSGSTASGGRLTRIKRAVYAQAEVLSRLGIKFEIWAHSGGWPTGEDYSSERLMDVWLFPVKKVEQNWDTQAKQRLADLSGVSGNLDGHTLEIYRKRADAVRATDVIICYYTDGAMPETNYTEELEILQREIDVCRKKGYTLLGVGINTDSPTRYGLNTVQVDSDDDLIKVIKQLGEALTRK